MFCKNCGNNIPDGINVCPGCGTVVDIIDADQTAPLENVVEPEAAAVEEVNETVTADNNQTEILENNFAEFDFEEPQKKKSKKLWLKIGIPAVAVILVAAIVLNLGTIVGASIKLFGSNEDYFKHVEKKAFKDYNESVSEAYGKYISYADVEENARQGKMTVNVGDGLDDLLMKYGVNLNLDWLDGTNITMDVDANREMAKYLLSLNIGNTNIASLDMVSDIKTGTLYFKLAELSDKYLKMNAQLDENASKMRDALNQIYNNKDEMIPDEEFMNSLFAKYTDIVIDNVKNVKKYGDNVSVQGVSKECTVLEFKVDEEYLHSVCLEVLETLKQDKDIAEVIKNWQKYFDEHKEFGIKENIYDEYIKAIDKAIKDLKAVEIDENNELCKIKSYVNNAHEIIGREIIVDDKCVLYYITIEDGKDYLTDIKVSDTLSLSGKRTEKGDIANGLYTINYGGINFVDITLKDFDTEKHTGLVQIAPNAGMMNMFAMNAGDVLQGLKPTIDFVIEENKIKLNVCNNKELLLGLEFENTEKEMGEVSIPSDSVDANDYKAMEEWAQSIDVEEFTNKLLENLEKAGVPQEYLLIIKTAISGATTNDIYDEDAVIIEDGEMWEEITIAPETAHGVYF